MKTKQQKNPYKTVGCTGYVTEQQAASAILKTLIARGGKFYTYAQQDILLLDGQVIDLYYSRDIRDVLIQTLKIPRLKVCKTLREHVRNQAFRLQVNIPVGVIGTVNGIKEPKYRITTRLSKPARSWLQAALNSNIIQGVPNEN